MQVFNEINARKLGDREFNVFSGFFNNFLFLGIVVATIIVQICLVQYGGQPMRTSPLTFNQHILCLSIGLFSLVQGKANYLCLRCNCEVLLTSFMVRRICLQGRRNEPFGRERLSDINLQKEFQRVR